MSSSRYGRRQQFGIVFRHLSISIAFASLLLLILLSPFLLRALTRENGIHWALLSNVGQTYGAASAILSGIALIGVSLSLLIQAEQARAERIRVVRERHMELLRIVLEDPETYARAMGMDIDPLGENIRAFIFVTMLVNYGRMGYQMGVLTESSIRADFFNGLFRSELGRAWWNKYGPLWTSSPVPERRARQFVKIMDDEYRKALAMGPPTIISPLKKTADRVSQLERRTGFRHSLLEVTVGLVIGVTIGCGIPRIRRQAS